MKITKKAKTDSHKEKMAVGGSTVLDGEETPSSLHPVPWNRLLSIGFGCVYDSGVNVCCCINI